ncbi:carbohydrate-binding module family 13 protein [Gelatoporia subvermispora B]|uniref:Carbohydrate-binding module family 13 protein n=1 Tax=Ceriporiopsis subvermispora (strain B) TaxID=914234 RepID=M2R636_CERS8|nr:carbohydrate-binding module family 13 protein [Gelatoporia subvermispora B]
MSTPYIPSIAEGAYWVRNKSTKWSFGLGPTPSGGNTPLVGQDPHPLRQALTDQSQMWLFEPLSDGRRFRIRNAQLGSLLDVSGSSTADGASVILYTPTGNANQDWTVEWVDGSDGASYYRIINVYTKKCLTQTTTSGNPIVSSAWVDGDQQRWSFEPVVFPPVYWISHAETGWYLQYDKSNGATVGNKISATADTRAQLWFLESRADSDAYVIRSVEDDKKVLDLSESSMDDGAPVIAYTYHGGKNQQWVISDLETSNPDEDRVKIFSALAHTVVQVIQGSSSGTLQAQTDKGNTSQSWRLHQYPFTPVYWTTIQNLKSGTFLRQDSSSVTPSSGAANALDFSVQWRFVPDRNQPHHYRLVNRGTNWVILGRSTSPTVTAAEQNREERGDLWAIERAGPGIAIVNTITVGALDHYAGGTTIEAYPNNGVDNVLHQWVTVQVSDRVPSFALVNSRTGRSLTLKSSKESDEQGVTTSPDVVNDWSNQWFLDNLSGEDGSDSPTYAIISKVSGTVLDHYYSKRVEAYYDTTDHPNHQWRLLPCPCGERYFQIVNVATGRFLEERETGIPNANATTPMNPTNPTDNDRAQCWELVSTRLGDYDLIIADDDVLQRLLPYSQPDVASELEHHIVKRAPGREKKGKRKDTHIPQNPRLLQDVAQEITAAFEYMIGQWLDDTIPSNVQAGTRVSVVRSELEANTNVSLPRGLRPGSDTPGWIRIDIQGTYESTPGQRVANIQGQWNNQSVFHVIVPVGARIGRQIIQDAMRLSLRQHTSVILEASNSKPSSGGSKPGSKPPPPPGPSGGSGNGWIYYTAVLGFVLLLSPLGM